VSWHRSQNGSDLADRSACPYTDNEERGLSRVRQNRWRLSRNIPGDPCKHSANSHGSIAEMSHHLNCRTRYHTKEIRQGAETSFAYLCSNHGRKNDKQKEKRGDGSRYW
jgi:hypothetical protein